MLEENTQVLCGVTQRTTLSLLFLLLYLTVPNVALGPATAASPVTPIRHSESQASPDLWSQNLHFKMASKRFVLTFRCKKHWLRIPPPISQMTDRWLFFELPHCPLLHPPVCIEACGLSPDPASPVLLASLCLAGLSSWLASKVNG